MFSSSSSSPFYLSFNIMFSTAVPTQEVSNFQHHTQLCYRCSISLLSSLYLIQFTCQETLLAECRLCQDNPGFNFTCTSCIICVILPRQLRYVLIQTDKGIDPNTIFQSYNCKPIRFQSPMAIINKTMIFWALYHVGQGVSPTVSEERAASVFRVTKIFSCACWVLATRKFVEYLDGFPEFKPISGC